MCTQSTLAHPHTKSAQPGQMPCVSLYSDKHNYMLSVNQTSMPINCSRRNLLLTQVIDGHQIHARPEAVWATRPTFTVFLRTIASSKLPEPVLAELAAQVAAGTCHTCVLWRVSTDECYCSWPCGGACCCAGAFPD